MIAEALIMVSWEMGRLEVELVGFEGVVNSAQVTQGGGRSESEEVIGQGYWIEETDSDFLPVHRCKLVVEMMADQQKGSEVAACVEIISGELVAVSRHALEQCGGGGVDFGREHIEDLKLDLCRKREQRKGMS